MSDKMREAFVQACKEYGPTISFGDFECGWDACMAWQAARTVPEGFVMVPVEPTQKILGEMRKKHWEIRGCQLCDDDYRDIFAAMLSAAPKKEPRHD